MATQKVSRTDEKMRPSAVFAARLREIRKARGLSQELLAHSMTEGGRPLNKAALLRIESGERGLALDEALALAALLHAAPAHLLSPPEEEALVWLTDQRGVDGDGMRDFLRFGEPLALSPEGQRARLSSSLEQAVIVYARALVDAVQGNDRAGQKEALLALGRMALAHREALEGDDG